MTSARSVKARLIRLNPAPVKIRLDLRKRPSSFMRRGLGKGGKCLMCNLEPLAGRFAPPSPDGRGEDER